ncbi:ATP-dependent nuclease [Megamonas rupellensis]|uniref:ATP-dependent nuclease n=1 Tax=Megamonas rupellensis TaxID=491921 RepID=UPI002420237E|nr:AAA family ATPase [Megamonas rupellensis]
MILRKMQLSNYRNLNNISVSFSDDINYIVGENNLGKSNLLYAINHVLLGKPFLEDDFSDSNTPIEIKISLRLNDYEKGIFDDLIDPLDSDYININVIQENCDEHLKYSHAETGELISISDIKKSLIVINYDSIRNPKNEINFSRKNGAGTFLNFIIQKYINDNPDEYYLHKRKINRIEKDLSKTLNKLAYFPKFSLKVKAEENNFDLLSKLLRLTDENNIPLSKLGYGVQYTVLIILSILEKIIAIYKQNNITSSLQTMLIFDEPEIHLHPYLQRTLIKDIIQISKGKNIDFMDLLKSLFGISNFNGQIIIATHSPNIILDTNEEYKKLIRFYIDNNITQVINTQDINLEFNEQKQLLMQFEYIKEAIFSKGVIIIEGQSEYNALKYFGSTLDIDFDKNGIALIASNGAKSCPALIKLFNKLEIPSIAIVDKDQEDVKLFDGLSNIIFTDKLDFENELVFHLSKIKKTNILIDIIHQYTSNKLDNTIKLKIKLLNNIIKKLSLSLVLNKESYTLDEVKKDPTLCKVFLIAWYSKNKGTTLGKLIGKNLNKEILIPNCYKNALIKLNNKIQ